MPLFPISLQQQHGYIDETGRIYINRQGIDPQGRRAIATTYRYAHGFSEGLAAVHPQSLKRATYIDKVGDVVIGELPCDAAGPFTNGLACITTSERRGQFGYINRSGDYVWEPTN